MTKSILSRYDQAETGEVILDVAAFRVADLYEDIDRGSPFLKKDLDSRLADYLINGAREIGKVPFVIRISVGEIPTDELQERISRSVTNYFSYMSEVERREMRDMARTSLLLFVAGLGFLALAAYTSELIAENQRVWAHIFPEGITVAGWVSLWHAIATFLIQWAPRRQRIRLYRRLATAPISFSEPS